MRHFSFLLLPTLILVLLAGGDARAQLIANFSITEVTFSPNGDGIEDSTSFTYTLSDTAKVLLVVFEKDSSTVVDTLLSLDDSLLVGTIGWDGTFAGGAPVPEDSFIVFLRAQDALAADSLYRVVKIDRTAPQVIVTNGFPFLFGPGSPDLQSTHYTIEYDVFDAAPSEAVRAVVTVIDPTGAIVDTLRSGDVAANASHSDIWEGDLPPGLPQAPTPEGLYDVLVAIIDQAGNTASDFTRVNVDLLSPDVEITSLVTGGSFQVIDNTLAGWAWDINGIDSVRVRYLVQGGPEEPFLPILPTTVVDDTFFFDVPLADSVTADSTYDIEFEAFDRVQRREFERFSITLDRFAPDAPVLVQPASPTQRPMFLLNASDVDNSADRMRIIRNGTEVAVISVFPGITELPYEVSLLSGENRISATLLDAADNESAASNQIVVVFDGGAGLFIPQPFLPNETFLINLRQDAARLDLNIYDLGGHLIEQLTQSGPGTNFSVPWDGLNGDGDEVKKGPLVLVLRTVLLSGESEIQRKIFLFQP